MQFSMQEMMEKDPLPTSDEAGKNGYFTKCVDQYMRVENGFKSLYCRAIKIMHARDFLAEFLATFMLVVRGTVH